MQSNLILYIVYVTMTAVDDACYFRNMNKLTQL